MGAQPPPTLMFLVLRAYKNHCTAIRGYFRFKKLLKNRYFTRYRVLKLRCLLQYTLIFLYMYVDLTSKFLTKMHTRKEPPPQPSIEPPSYRLTSTPLRSVPPKRLRTTDLGASPTKTISNFTGLIPRPYLCFSFTNIRFLEIISRS